MMMIQAIVRSHLMENKNFDPAKLLQIVNRTIRYNLNNMNEEKFMTICALDIKKNGEVKLSGRHEDILLYKAATKNVEVITTDGICLSSWKLELGNYDKNISFSVEKRDVILLYTDGIIECRDRNNTMFSQSRLIDAFAKSGHKTVDEIKKDLLSAIYNYCCYDDLTFIVLKKI